MTTTTTLARGGALDRQDVADGWVGYTNVPELTGHPRYEALIAALVRETERVGDTLLPDGAQWFPAVGEIIGEVGTSLGEDFDTGEFAALAAAGVDYAAVEAAVLA